MSETAERVPVGPRDEAPHEDGGAPGWSERLSFNFFDEDAGFGGIARVEFRPADRRAEGSVSLFMPGGALATVLARQPIQGLGGSSVARIRLDPFEALRKWRLRCKDVALVFPNASAAGLPGKGERHGAAAQLDLEVTFESWMEPWGSVAREKVVDALGFVNVVSSGHFEQAGRYSGSIRVGGRQATLQGHGVRDRSWGVRSHTASHASVWLAAAFGPAASFGVRLVAMGERGLSSGWIRIDSEQREITAVHLERDEEGQAVRAVRARVTDSAGAIHELEGETLATMRSTEARARMQQSMTRFRWSGREGLGLAEYVAG